MCCATWCSFLVFFCSDMCFVDGILLTYALATMVSGLLTVKRGGHLTELSNFKNIMIQS